MGVFTFQTPTTVTAVVLDEHESHMVLKQAVTRGVPIQLSAVGAPDALVWRGALRGETPEALVLRSVDRWVEPPVSWRDTALRATFCVANRAYAFDTTLASDIPDQDVKTIGIRRPNRVQEIERRRARRRRFHGSTCVHLLVGDEETDPIKTNLLKLSTHGLACQADESVFALLPLDAQVGVAFELEGAGRFELDARIITATPGSEEDVVLGIEFIENAAFDAQRDRLLRVLTADRGVSESVGRSRRDHQP